MPSAPTFLDPPELLRHLDLAPGMQVGDFGVGAGAVYSIPAAQLIGRQGRVFMFDARKSALSGAAGLAGLKGLDNCQPVWTNLEIYNGASQVKDEALDAGLLINLLCQSQLPKGILAEVHRMLKVGAKLLIVDWRPDVKSPIALPASRRSADRYVEQLAKSIGFAPVEKFSAGSMNWGLVVAKT